MSNEDLHNVFIGDIQKRLRKGTALTCDQAEALANSNLSPEVQCAALAGLLLRNSLSESEKKAAIFLSKQHTDVFLLLNRPDLLKDIIFRKEPDESYKCWKSAFKALLENNLIGRTCLSTVVTKISKSVDLKIASALLMVICVRGMQSSDVLDLTDLMAKSGEQFDYRYEKSLCGARLIRRYPTGALSEKIALILPALIACAMEHVKVYTPFLVARSLGHTGGTWDKLNAVPGFRFPEPGEESIATLLKCGVAMTVTKGAANPADRVLYQLRSLTGTVESIPLIVSSIASKQICFPVHRLMMDVRYGNGAFLENSAEAELLGKELRNVLCSEGIPTFFTLTDTEQPTGSSIGNAIEVAEAIAVMGGSTSTLWNTQSLIAQRMIVIDFFAKLMTTEFPVRSEYEWANYATNQFNSGKIIRAFANILLAHRVPNKVVEEIIKKPLNSLSISNLPVDIYARSSGTLVKIEQRRLGEIINSNLKASRCNVEGDYDPRVGIVIPYRLGDKINEGSVLCKIFADRDVVEPLSKELKDCFILA